jgi:hypothetical protein
MYQVTRSLTAPDQARDLLDAATAVDGPGTGWDLHELRRSGLTHLDEADGEIPAPQTREPNPSPQAMRELTSLLGPDYGR